MTGMDWQRLIVVLVGVLSVHAASFGAQAEAQGVVASYAAGDSRGFDHFLADTASTRDGGFRTFERDARAWLSKGGDLQSALPAVAAALEVAHALRDRPAEQPARYIHWAAKLVDQRRSSDVGELERLSYLACLATALELTDPWPLVVGQRTGARAVVALAESFGEGGLLAVAQRRFPAEQRFDLIAASYLETKNLAIDPLPELLELAEQNIKIKIPIEPKSSAENTLVDLQWTASSIMRSVASSSELGALFARLTNVASISGEVALHQGVIDMRGRRLVEAAAAFERLEAASADPFVRFLAAHFLGRTEHYRGRQQAAIAAFERSMAIMPQARSSVTWLSALLMTTDSAADHDRAVELMTSVYQTPPVTDPLNLYSRGEARHRAAYLDLLRKRFQ
jgi:hypothetical protein